MTLKLWRRWRREARCCPFSALDRGPLGSLLNFSDSSFWVARQIASVARGSETTTLGSARPVQRPSHVSSCCHVVATLWRRTTCSRDRQRGNPVETAARSARRPPMNRRRTRHRARPSHRGAPGPARARRARTQRSADRRSPACPAERLERLIPTRQMASRSRPSVITPERSRTAAARCARAKRSGCRVRVVTTAARQ